MKSKLTIFFLFHFAFLLIAEPFPHETYIVSYGEAPVGQHPIGFSSHYYSLDECEKMAREEAENFATGQIYGYSFEYQIENPITKRGEYFNLVPDVLPNYSGRNVTFKRLSDTPLSYAEMDKYKVLDNRLKLGLKLTNSEMTEYETLKLRFTGRDFKDRVRFQLTYKLLEQQKKRRKNFAGALAESAKGEDFSQDCQDWTLRKVAFENAVKNAIFNKARKDIKSRPEYICGKVMLKESPMFSINSGLWKVIVHVSITIDEITYQSSY